jgi:hypothetical protein
VAPSDQANAPDQRPALPDSLTGEHIMGTPKYMSPEQITAPGEVDHRADIYALGVVFYQMLTGELPGKKIEPPSKKVQIDVRLDEVVLRALEQNPDRRYQQVSEVKTCVETIIATPGGSRREEAQTKRGKPNESLLTSSPTNQEPRFSRTAIVGACWTPFFILAAGLFFAVKTVVVVSAGAPSPGPAWWPAVLSITLLPLGLTAPFGATILGWVAVSQIRRSAGKLHGLWLAMFDGLFFPLLALDALIFIIGWFAAGQMVSGAFGDTPDAGGKTTLFFVIWLSGATLAAAILDWLIIRRVWRAVNTNIAVSENPTRRPRFGLWFAIACAVLVGILGMMIVLRHSGGVHITTKLADSPQDLQKASTAQVLAAALENKLSPWAWQELEKRPLTTAEVAQIMDGLVAWLQQDFPNGHPNPLNWLDNSLEGLDARHLLTDDQKIRLLTALHGNLRIEPLPRSHEGDLKYLDLDGECRWTWRQDFLGLTMMNGPISVSVDGQPLPPNKNYQGSWTWSYPRINATWPLPALAVGRHIVKVENVSALVAKEDLTGLSSTAPPSDWPPAKKRWTRTVELELNVYSTAAVLVQTTQEPALDPVRNGSLSVNPVIIRSKGNGAQATVTFNLPQKDSVPVSFNVALRIGGQTVSCGSLWAVQTSHGKTCSGMERSTDLVPPAATVTEADIILTPNPKPIEHMPSVDRIWGGQIIFSNVPLKRLDLNTAAPNLAFGPVKEWVLPFHTNLPGVFMTRVLDLDSGQVLDRRPKGNHGPCLCLTDTDILVVSFFDGFVVLDADGAWDSADAMQTRALVERIQHSSTVTSAAGPLDKKLPKTYLIKTSDENIGLLQITGFTDNPRGVKIRYKLVQNPNQSSTSSDSKPPTDAFQIRRVADDSDDSAGTDTVTNFLDANHVASLRLLPGVLLDGKAVERAGWNATDGRTNFVLGLTEAGSQQFEELTATNLQRRIAMIFQGRVLFAPNIQAAIHTRSLKIPVNWDMKDLERTMNGLNQMNSPVVNLRFGPEQESILPPLNGIRTFLNLRANRLFSSTNPDYESRAFHDWQRANGADVNATVGQRANEAKIGTLEEENFPALVTYDMATAPAIANGLDNASPADIWYNWSLMTDEPSAQTYLVKLPTNGPDTYYFRTRDGVFGVLQITGFTENPRGVKIRYKLVQNGW